MAILRPPRFVLRGLKEFASWLQNQQIEAGLGNPERDGYHLASDADGTRYWEPPPSLNPDDEDAETTRWKIKAFEDDYAPIPGDDRNTLLVSTASSAVNLNMFQDIFEVGSQLFIWQYGAGQITVAEGTNVTVRTPETLTFNEQYASISMVQVFPNEWLIAGRMTPA
jgi:hypothetical protein